MSAAARELPAPALARWMRAALIAAIRIYQMVVSPLLGPACRFEPSCSSFAVEAIASRGVVRGSWLALRRIARCHPWGGFGYDPVP
jgi:hypothetical protein